MKNGKNHQVSLNQGAFSIVMFGFGSSVVMGVSTGVGQDAWIAILIATAVVIPFFLMYARIIKLFPEKNLYEISEVLFGKIGGKAITVMFIWYAIHLTSLVLRNFSEYIQISARPETPQLPILILMVLTTAYLASSNMRAIGKWSVITAFVVIFAVIFTFTASLKQMKIFHLLPIMQHSPAQLGKASFQIFSFPYAEIVMFLCVANSFKKNARSYKMFIHALILISIIFLLVFFRNITMLGSIMMEFTYFPSFISARLIDMGGFISRIEGSISTNLLLAGIVKVSVCLMAAANGLKSLFNLRDYRTMVLPVGMLAVALSTILFANTMEMFNFFDYYAYYAFPFQVIIPMVIWIAGEIHIRKKNTATLQQ